MASAALATAFVNIVPGTKEMESYLKTGIGKDGEKAGDNLSDGMTKGFGAKFPGAMKGIMAGIGAAFTIGAVTDFAKEAITAAEGAQSVDKKLSTVATSMGTFGSETDTVVGRLKSFAEEQMKLTGTDDEVIKGAQTKLLTFKNLADSADTAGGAFDRATGLSSDMGAVFGGDASTNAVLLGKALNDPEKGISALSRVGVQFTDDQKKMIAGMVEAGDIAGAQEIILGELETQVGGAAGASATAGDKMKTAFGEVTESLGGLLLPAFEGMAGFITDMISNLPAFLPLLAGLGTILLGIGIYMGVMSVNAMILAAGGLPAVIAATIAWTAALLLNPITWIVLGVAALVAGIVLLAQNWDAVTKWIGDVWAGFMSWIDEAFKNIATWWEDLWNGVGKFIEDWWPLLLGILTGGIGLVVGLIVKNWDAISKFFEDSWNAIAKTFSDAWAGIASWWDGVIAGFTKGWESAWSGLGSFIEDTFNNIVGFVKAPLNAVIGLINKAIGGINSIKIDIPDWVPLIGGTTLGFSIPKIPQLAKGGFVTSPTTALIGEAGPEVVTPLKDFERMMGIGGPAADRPIYADGIGLLGWIREEAQGQATLVFNDQLNRLTRGSR